MAGKKKCEYDFDFREVYGSIHEAHSAVSDLICDEKRGAWGTEVEAAISTAEADLASAMEQLEFVRKERGWNQ